MPLSLFRTILTSLLIGLMMLGNAAAWVHHGTCNDRTCQSVEADVASHCHKTHCCHARHVVSSKVPTSIGGLDATEHDAKACLACQLAAAGGYSASLDAFEVNQGQRLVALVASFSEDTIVAFSASQLRLRGPPVNIA